MKKKQYEKPMAERFVFNYLENVVASTTPDWYDSSIKGGKTGPSWDACFAENTGNGDQVYYSYDCYIQANPKNGKGAGKC